MKRAWVWLLLLVGCGAEPVLPALAPPPVDVEVQVERPSVGSGEPIVVEVTRWTSEEWVLPPVGPVAEKLQTAERSVDGPAIVGNRARVVATYELSGEDGSHVVVVPPVEATGPGDQKRTIEPPPVFVDIGAPPAPLDGLVGPEGLPEPSSHPVWQVAAAAGSVALVAALFAGLWIRSRRPAPEPPLPADVVARTAWGVARQEASDDHALALALSQIFRRFLQDVSGFPMLARTTREIVHHLEQENLLEDVHRRRARRVLDATDRLKFAREGGGDEFFAELEADFLAVVDILSRPVEPNEVNDVAP